MKSLGLVRFGPLTPDQPDFGNLGMEAANNVIAIAAGYQPLRELQPYTDTLDSRCMGAYSVKDEPGNAYNFAGDVTKLYEFTGGSWVDVSKGGGYSNNTTRWSFTEFRDRVIATNYRDDPQSKILTGGPFADLTTDFRAQHVSTVRNFVVFGNTTDATDGDRPTRVRWSARGDPTDYTPSSSTLAGFQDLDGEPIRQVVSGEYGVIFQEASITRMTFRGDANVWQFDVVEPQIGTRSPGSVVRWGYDIYFLADDGFRVFRGATSSPIGEEQVDRSVLGDLNETYIDRVTAAFDAANSIVIWAYPGAGNTGGTPNKLVIYNPTIGRWTTGDEAVDILFRSAPSAINLDTDLNAADIPLEVAGSLDDKIWQGGNFTIAAFRGGINDAAFFDGPSRLAELATAEQQVEMGRKSMLRWVRPIVDGGDVSIAIGHRNRQSDPVTWTMPVMQDASGRCKFRIRSRYIRARALLSGNWTDAVGIEPTVRPAGRR